MEINMEKKFFTYNGNVVLGPYSLNELMRMSIMPNTLLFTYELGVWVYARQIPEIAIYMSHFSQKPPIYNSNQQQIPPQMPSTPPQMPLMPYSEYSTPTPSSPNNIQPVSPPHQEQIIIESSNCNKYLIYNQETDEQKGPFAIPELLSNGLKIDSQVFCDEMNDWEKAYLIPELQQLFPKEEIEKKKYRMFANPFSYKGRITRKEYWISTVISIIFLFLALLCLGLTIVSGSIIPLVVSFVIIIPTLWFWTAQGAKRCHDFSEDASYQYKVLGGLFFIGVIVLFFFGREIFIEDGVQYDNEYGTDPKEFQRHLITDETRKKMDDKVSNIYYISLSIFSVIYYSIFIALFF